MRRVVGLSLNDDGWGLVVVQGRGLQEKILLSLNGTWFSPDSGGRGMELRRVWLENRLPARAFVSLAVQGVVWTTLDLPPVQEKDIPPAIRASLEVSNQNQNGCELAYEVLERGEKLKVRAGAIDARDLAPWIELLESADIDPEGIVTQAQAVSLMIAQSPEPKAFLIQSGDLLEIGISKDGTPGMLRTMAFGQLHGDGVRQEMSFTRHAWARLGFEAPDKLIAFGEGAGFSSLTWEDVWGSRPFQGEKILDGRLSSIAAYGSARFSRKPGMLWRPACPKSVRRDKRQTVLLALATVGFLVLGSLFFYLAHMKEIEEQNRWIESRIALYRELEALQSQDERMSEKIQGERRQWEGRPRFSRYLDHWQAVVPEGTVLSSWTMKDDQNIEIAGRTPSIAVLLERLTKDRIFSGLAVKGSVVRNPKGWDEFRLSGELGKGAGDAN